MITKEILEAQLGLYCKGRAEALVAIEKARADVNAFNGAIEACENLMRILESFETAAGESQESSTPSVEYKRKGGLKNA